jgi:hypothetical protein
LARERKGAALNATRGAPQTHEFLKEGRNSLAASTSAMMAVSIILRVDCAPRVVSASQLRECPPRGGQSRRAAISGIELGTR